jgi:hypothetical protein
MGAKMNIPEDIKKWLASLDKEQEKQLVLYITSRFVNELLPKLLKNWSENRRGR